MLALLLVNALCSTELEPIPVPKGLSNIDACAVCKNVISGIIELLYDPLIESEFYDLALKQCDSFSIDSAKSLCVTIVEDYIKKVISLIIADYSKADICAALRLCEESNDFEADYIIIPEGLENGIACSICKHLVTAISKVISSTQSQTEITEQAKKLCSKFPKIGRDFCNSIVGKYLPKLITWVNDKLSTTEICSKLKLCQSNDDNDDAYLELYLEMDENDYVTDIELPLGLSNADNCAICKKAVGFVSAAMKNSLVQAVVKAAATSACGAISSGVGAGLCRTIVGSCVGPIMTWLGQKLSQSKICSKLGYCKGNSIDEGDDEIAYVEIPDGLDNASACVICKNVVNGMKTIVDVSSKAESVKKIVSELCTKIPVIGKGICTSMVGNYFTPIYNMILSGMSSINICQKIGLC
ncbi:Saposin-like type B, region 1 family protein [Histomonas meleagridis]|uniref:Saposin-like type B, region 1 family protein n=1 Tax=Histomonas meleagridis TaxID=135588 RepID=UPI003559A1A8|nr:Saposin-like type B, region 1 family protein [Histomonas meleagridis]KAH0799581.1 Saposin-like type B, region 1 family protein [Histomonas meleagridis]